MKKRKKIFNKGKLLRHNEEFLPANRYTEAMGSEERGTGIYILYKIRGHKNKRIRGRKEKKEALKKAKIYYIGKSERSMKSRIKSHDRRDRHAGKWTHFSYYRIGKGESSLY